MYCRGPGIVQGLENYFIGPEEMYAFLVFPSADAMFFHY